jgi:hypothetical protein
MDEIIKTYDYKNHLIWKKGNGTYTVEAIGEGFTTLKQCKESINNSTR